MNSCTISVLGKLTLNGRLFRALTNFQTLASNAVIPNLCAAKYLKTFNFDIIFQKSMKTNKFSRENLLQNSKFTMCGIPVLLNLNSLKIKA